jgi:branched-chain amino acid transport system substrate-binding protein
MRSWSWRALACLTLISVVSACATPKPAPVVQAPVVEEAPPPPPVVEAPKPEPKPIVRPAEPANQLKVAVLVPLTGNNARVGQAIANAATLALLEMGGGRIKLTNYNTETGAAAAAQAAIADGAKVILGPLFAGEVRVVQPVARAAGVPVITFSNDASVAQAGTYVLGFQPSQEIARVVDYAKRRGINRFGALVPQGQYGSIASRAMQNAVQSSGGALTAIESYPRDRAKLFASARRVTNYEGRLQAARNAAAAQSSANAAVPTLAPPPFEGLLIADGGGLARAFVPVLRQFGAAPPRVRLIGPGLWAAEPEIAGEPGLIGAWFAAVPDDEFNAMARRYRGQFGANPPRLASLGYDAVLLVAGVSQGWRSGQAFPTAALGASGGFTGVDGIFRFRASGVAERGMEVLEVTGGGFRTVSPAPRAFATASARPAAGR